MDSLIIIRESPMIFSHFLPIYSELLTIFRELRLIYSKFCLITWLAPYVDRECGRHQPVADVHQPSASAVCEEFCNVKITTVRLPVLKRIIFSEFC
jgi:hypothetical protein